MTTTATNNPKERGLRAQFRAEHGGQAVGCEASGAVTLLGSRRNCDLPVNHPDITGLHCAVVFTGRAFVVVDLRSRAGTFVNDRIIDVAVLNPGDTLRLGPVPVEVDIELATDGQRIDQKATRLEQPLVIEAPDGRYEMASAPIVIGRRRSCHVVVDTPDVSLAHALLFLYDGCPALFDLSSRSGTILNGQRISLAWLRDGDKLDIGGQELRVEWPGSVRQSADQTQPGLGVLAPASEPAPPAPAKPSPALPVAALASEAASEAPAAGATASDLQTRVVAVQSHLATFAAELAARAASLGEREERVKRAEGELTAQRGQLETERAAVKASLAACNERAAALDARERDVAKRQADLAAQRKADQRTLRQIEQFKSLLIETAGAKRGGRKGGNATLETAASHEPAPAAAARFPGPVVDRPLFESAGDGAAEIDAKAKGRALGRWRA